MVVTNATDAPKFRAWAKEARLPETAILDDGSLPLTHRHNISTRTHRHHKRTQNTRTNASTHALTHAQVPPAPKASLGQLVILPLRSWSELQWSVVVVLVVCMCVCVFRTTHSPRRCWCLPSPDAPSCAHPRIPRSHPHTRAPLHKYRSVGATCWWWQGTLYYSGTLI